MISGSGSNSNKMTVFWDAVSHSLEDTDRRFTGAYCLHHRSDCNIPEDSHIQGD
jgi:hypothetical protein